MINALWAPPLADLANRAGSSPLRNQQQLQSGRARPRRTWVVSRYQDRRSYLIGSPRRTQGPPCLPGEGRGAPGYNWRYGWMDGCAYIIVEDDWETGCLSFPRPFPPSGRSTRAASLDRRGHPIWKGAGKRAGVVRPSRPATAGLAWLAAAVYLV